MRQSSTAFMDEMLKDNTPKESGGMMDSEKIAQAIDKKIDEAMQKISEQLSKPVVQANNNESEDLNNDAEGKGSSTGADGAGAEGAEDGEDNN